MTRYQRIGLALFVTGLFMFFNLDPSVLVPWAEFVAKAATSAVLTMGFLLFVVAGDS